MELEDLIVKRVSIRKWLENRPVEKEKLEKVLDAARRAPSWGNVQSWRFVVVQDRAKIEKMGEMSGSQDCVTNAGAVIVCCGVAGDFNKNLQRAALKSVMDVDGFDWTTDFLDDVVMQNDMFAPYMKGKEIMEQKAGETIMIAISYMTLEAVNQGLGTCWVGATDCEGVGEYLNLPKEWFVHDLLPIGYAAEEPKPRPRKKLDDIVFWETV
jgi:nitroreductase